MATVTFPIELGGSGLVVSDDTDPTTGLRNGGYLTRFVPALQQTVAVAGFVVGQANAAASSASAASSSASSAASSAASAATLYDQFDDRYLGPKSANPTVDNDGNALLVGAMYFNTVAMETRVWNGTGWQSPSVIGGTVNSLTVTGAFEYQGALTGGTGVINIGSGQFYKDAAGNLGIGNTSPSFNLDLGKSTATTSITHRTVTNAGFGAFGRYDVSGVGTLSVGFNNSAGVVNNVPAGVAALWMQQAFPVVIGTNGQTRLTVDPVGNAGLGETPSNWVSLKAFDINTYGSVAAATNRLSLAANSYFDGSVYRYKTTGQASRFDQIGGEFQWFTAPSGTAGNPITFTQSMTLTQGGNLLVGTTSDVGAKIFASVPDSASFVNAFAVSNASNSNLFIKIRNTECLITTDVVGSSLLLGTANTERARITSGGYFKASNTGSYSAISGNRHEVNSNQNDVTFSSANTSTGSSVRNFQSELGAGAAGRHFQGVSNGASVFQVEENGNVQNTNNSYGAISDPKLKDIIGPKASTWEKTKQYNWIEYYLKSDAEHTFKMLGLNAEEAAAISPGVVDEAADLVEVTKIRQVPVQIVRTDENDNPVLDEQTGNVIYDEVMVDEEYTEWEPNGEFTKSVKYSVVSMQYHRTTQECQTRIESLESAKTQSDDLIQQIMGRVAALEALSS